VLWVLSSLYPPSIGYGQKIQSAKQSAAQVMVRYAAYTANAKAIHLTTKGSAFKQTKTQAWWSALQIETFFIKSQGRPAGAQNIARAPTANKKRRC
jgi:hypothetical protein